MNQSFHHFFSAGGKNLLYPPDMNIPILVARDVLSSDECAEIARELVISEKRLLKEHPAIPVAGLTDGLTTRWLGYNVLSWELDAVHVLRKNLSKLYLSYLKKSGLKRWPNEIQCWGNILRRGEFLKQHCHNFLARPALTMALSLTDAKTETIYQFPFPLTDGKHSIDRFGVPTRKGTLIMVPGWVTHYTTPHMESGKRITLGLDIASGLTKGARVEFDDGKRFKI